MTTRRQLFLGSILVFQMAAVSLIDYFSGYEVRVGALYAIPIGFSAWFFGGAAGVIVGALVTGAGWWIELAGGATYSAGWIPVVNALSRLALFLFVAFAFAYFRKSISAARTRLQAFEGRLPICTCCHRIDAGDGFWTDFPTYLRRNSEVQTEFRICPVCVKAGE